MLSHRISTLKKVALFRRLFRGHTGLYPIRWESKITGKSSCAPACANGWLVGVSNRTRIKCSDCNIERRAVCESLVARNLLIEKTKSLGEVYGSSMEGAAKRWK
jgi:hypothetical protein